jgi:hypothetical protein
METVRFMSLSFFSVPDDPLSDRSELFSIANTVPLLVTAKTPTKYGKFFIAASAARA